MPTAPTQMLYESSTFFEDFMRPLFYESIISFAASLRIHAALNLLYLAVGNTHV